MARRVRLRRQAPAPLLTETANDAPSWTPRPSWSREMDATGPFRNNNTSNQHRKDNDPETAEPDIDIDIDAWDYEIVAEIFWPSGWDDDRGSSSPTPSFSNTTNIAQKVREATFCNYVGRIWALRLASIRFGVPETLGGLNELQHLDLRGADGLVVLPESTGLLRKLRVLDLGSTPNLRELPPAIGLCTSLEKLNLACSGIRKLPDSIGNLQRLRYLNLHWTHRLTKLPKSLGMLRALKELKLENHFSAATIPDCTTTISSRHNTCWHLESLEVLEFTSFSLHPPGGDAAVSEHSHFRRPRLPAPMLHSMAKSLRVLHLSGPLGDVSLPDLLEPLHDTLPCLCLHRSVLPESHEAKLAVLWELAKNCKVLGSLVETNYYVTSHEIRAYDRCRHLVAKIATQLGRNRARYRLRKLLGAVGSATTLPGHLVAHVLANASRFLGYYHSSKNSGSGGASSHAARLELVSTKHNRCWEWNEQQHQKPWLQQSDSIYQLLAHNGTVRESLVGVLVDRRRRRSSSSSLGDVVMGR